MIIDGLRIAKEIRSGLAEKIAASSNKPKLCVILVGKNPASLAYVGRKAKACAEVGMDYECLEFDETVSEAELLSAIEAKNADDSVDGIIVQLPLPAHISRMKVIQTVEAEKDVDGFTLTNVGKSCHTSTEILSGRESGLVSCTPK